MIKKSLSLSVLMFVVFSFVPVYAAKPPSVAQFMSLEEVEKRINLSSQRTVNAHFDTVLEGTKIVSLPLVIKGVYREPSLEIIVFKSKRQIAHGMSGSPAYIDGKLIGAVAYAFNASPGEYWGGISPISLMTDDANSGNNKLGQSFVYEGKLFKPISLGLETVFESGDLSGQKFIRTADAGGSESSRPEFSKSDIKAGMPIVVDLVEWTDEKGKTSTIGASGTITYVDGEGRVFAFGHPFMNSKDVVYGFRLAEIIGTVPSNSPDGALKLRGRSSDILGAITRDSSYGIYGKVGAGEELQRLRHFYLEFKNKGVSFHRFNIKVAESAMTPILVSAAFALIGQNYGAPLSQEVSVSQIESRIDLEGYPSILWKGLFGSSSFKFGPQVIYTSSFSSACEIFLNNIYGFLDRNNYGLKISDVSVSVNFIPGASQVYKVGAYKFPNKVVYGQDPFLDIMFVDENNTMPIAKRMLMKIDWSKVEKPVYTSQTADIDKVPEKIVNGYLKVQSSRFYLADLSSEENQKILPEYFIGPEDFLENLSRRLEITNQKIFTRAGLRSRSGLFDETLASSGDIMPDGITADEKEWSVIRGGLSERKVTLKDDGTVVFNFELPDIPVGYVFDQAINELIQFEVVLDK